MRNSKRIIGKVLSVTLALLMITSSVNASGIYAYAASQELTFEIGVNEKSVTAKLEADGVLVLTGAGDMRDFTPETAPFQSIAGQIRNVEIGGGITSIGSYTFYGCWNLKNTIKIPGNIVRIGKGAFSGGSADSAPSPQLVINQFTSKNITVQENGSDAEKRSDESGASAAGDGESNYKVVEITEQEIENNIFFPLSEEERYFISSVENETFRAAVTNAGFTEADKLARAVLDSGEKETGQAICDVPVINGWLCLPCVPDEWTEAGTGADAVFTYQFAGWTEENDPPDVVREPGSRLEAGEKEEYYLIASWRKVSASALLVKRGTDAMTLEVPSVSGYEIMSVRWQIGEKDQAADVVWSDIPNKTETVYTRENQAGDENRLFRAIAAVEKKSFFRLFAFNQDSEEIEFEAIAGIQAMENQGQTAETEFTLSFLPGAAGGVAAGGSMASAEVTAGGETLVPLCSFTQPETSPDRAVFCGWLGDDGSTYDPGDTIVLSQDITLTAQWTTSYSVETANSASAFSSAVSRLAGDSIYTNYVLITGDVELPATLPTTGKKITIAGKNPKDGTVYNPMISMQSAWDGMILGGDTRFENIQMKACVAQVGDLFANGYLLVLGEGITTLISDVPWQPEYKMRVSAGAPYYNEPGREGEIRIFSGDYAEVYGNTGNTLATTTNAYIKICGGRVEKLLGAGMSGSIGQDGRTQNSVDIKIGGAADIGGTSELGGAAGTVNDVFAGGNSGLVTGNTSISVSGESVVHGSLYGGGYQGAVRGNSTVKIYGGIIEGDVYGGGSNSTIGGDTSVTVYGGEIRGNIYGSGDRGTLSGSGSVTVSGGIIGESSGSGNIYGGARRVNLSKPSFVAITGGTIRGNVFGGGDNGQVPSSVVAVEGGEMHFVYGGGNHAAVSGTARTTISGGRISGDVSGGGLYGAVNSATVEITGDAEIERSVYGGGEQGDVSSDTAVYMQSGLVKSNLYGGGDYGNVFGTAVVSAQGGTVEGNIYGGGNHADVKATDVLVSGDTLIGQMAEDAPFATKNTGNVYAGGNYGAVTGTGVGAGLAKAAVTGGRITGNVFGGGCAGAVAGTEVTVSGEAVRIDSSVYAGGDEAAGIVSGDTKLIIENGTISGDIFGGGKNGEIQGKTEITLRNGTVAGCLYGGGYMGAVGNSTRVSMLAGQVAGNIYGGGAGSESDANIGAVAQATEVSISGGMVGTAGGSVSEKKGNVVGGGEYAKTGGSTAVVVSDTAVIANAVIGGGYLAPVEAESTVTIRNGTVSGSVYGGGYGSAAASTESSAVTVNNGVIGQSIYGGGAYGIVKGETSVTLNGGTIFGNLFGGGQGKADDADLGSVCAEVSAGTVSVRITGGEVKGSVYGGGDYGNVGRGTITGTGREITSSGTNSWNTTVKIEGGQIVAAVFGGGSGSAREEEASLSGVVFGGTSVELCAGSINGSVFGGCNRSYVTRDTDILIHPVRGDIAVRGSVFGGGNLPGGEEPAFIEDLYLVFGDSNIVVDDSGSSFKSAINGTITGCGNLTRVKGEGAGRNITIIGYQGEIESLQRADNLNIINSVIVLNGANDVTEPVVRSYSLSRIGQLRIANGSDITMKKEVRRLSAMGAYTFLGGDALNAANYEEHTAEEGRNMFRIYQGRIIQVRREDGQYGDVTGVMWLDILTEGGSQEYGITIQASLDSDTGDGEEDTGAFVKADTESSRDINLVSGTVPGAYSFWRLGESIALMDLTISALHGEKGGTGIAEEEFEVPTSPGRSEYVVTEAFKETGDFHLISPSFGEGGEVQFPVFQDDRKNNTFALSVEAVGDEESAWETAGGTVYFLTQGNTQDVELFNKDGYNPTASGGGETGSGKNGTAQFKLYYNKNFIGFSGGKLKITLKEYQLNADEQRGDIVNVVIINLTIEGEEGSGTSKTASIAKGQVIDRISGPQSVTINPGSSVSVFFSTSYYPESAGSNNMSIVLLQGSGETATETALPAGVKVMLADMGNMSDIRYYWAVSGGSPRITLNNFMSLGSSAGLSYPGPGDNTTKINEELLFVVDFSAAQAQLPDGEYSLCLKHSSGDSNSQQAGLYIDSSGTAAFSFGVDVTGARVVQLTAAATIPDEDTRYERGIDIKIRLYKADNTRMAVPLHAKSGTTSGMRFIGADGTVTLKGKSPSMGLSIDFSEVSNEEMPAGIYQIGAEWIGTGIPEVIREFEIAANTGEAGENNRGISVKLKSQDSRILDVSEENAVLNFDVTTQMEDGDQLDIKILRKNKEQNSFTYTEFSSAGGWVSITEQGSGYSAAVTVPKNTPPGTYRVQFRVKDGNGTVHAEAPYNFIVITS